MLKLQRKVMSNGGSPTQKRMRNISRDSSTEESSSFSFSRDDNDFADFVNNSPQHHVVQEPADSIFTDDQVVMPRDALHTSVGGLGRFSMASGLSKKKKTKKNKKESQEMGKGISKPRKSFIKATSGKTKKKQPVEDSRESPFWSLMETRQQLVSTDTGGIMPNSQTGNSEDSDGFGEVIIGDGQSFVSSDGFKLPSKASMEAEDRGLTSPSDGRRRKPRTKVSTATGTILLTPSKASLERTESIKSKKSCKKKRRPKKSNDLQSPTEKGLDSSQRENSSDEFSQSMSSPSQQSKSSRKAKSKNTASSKSSRKSKSVSPKPAARTITSLSPAIEGKPSSFSGLHQNSFEDGEEAENNKSKMKQPSKASLESMLERVSIRKRTRKSSASSVGSVRRAGKRPQAEGVSSGDSVVSLDTGTNKSNQIQPTRHDSLSGENSAALSFGSRKHHSRPTPKALPRRVVSYQSNPGGPVNQSPASAEGGSTQRSKASLQQMLEKRAGVKSRTSSASSVGSRRKEQSNPASNPSNPNLTSPKSILKVKRRNSFGNETPEHTEPRFIHERRASFSSGNSKHPSAHMLASPARNSNEERTPASQQRTRRGLKCSSLHIKKSKASSPTKGRKPRSRSLSPRAKGKQSSIAKVDLAYDPWDNIDEAFMPITSAKHEEHAKTKAAMEETQRPVLPGKKEKAQTTPDDMWASLAFVDTSNDRTSSPKQRQQEQRQQQLKATEALDAWWNVDEDDDQSLAKATRKKKLAQKSMLLVSASKIPPSMKSDSSGSPVLKSPPTTTAPKTSMHTSMPIPSLDNVPSTLQSPSSKQQRQSEPTLPASPAHKNSSSSPPTTKQRQSEPKRVVEVVNAWWAEDAEKDKESVAKETKKKQLARKSVLIFGSSSMNGSKSFDYSDDAE
ncbi:unnamed protein product [Cylindrotheca closterium]|uniref:Uncharacterized protein n=1 Tax=Cylindrotheca closterium TaxID=2856 RepID=A0AAD2FKQ3_9STRA|nr:unnamed protein product [Cylindrotheca closterium]